MANPGNTTIPGNTSTTDVKLQHKSHELVNCTIRTPAFFYAHLELMSPDGGSAVDLDELQVRAYCTSALKQFLGITGTAIALDILKVDGASCWVRAPRDDLGAFSAAIIAWQGSIQDGLLSTFRIRGCSDWLGSLVGRQGEENVWSG